MRSFATLITLALSAVVFAAPVAEPVAEPEAVELEARQSCKNVQVYFARGTTEPGTLGTVVGPAFSSALSTALIGKTLSFTGINYPADVAGYLAGGSSAGAQTMANLVTSTASSCPSTKIVISGYS